MAVTDIEFELKANATDFKKKMGEAKILARDTKVELNRQLLAKLELDVANFQVKLNSARKTLREAKKKGDLDATIKAQLDVNELQRGTTEAKRQLNNYVNTGNKDLSRLQAKFDSVNKTIVSSSNSVQGLIKRLGGVNTV